MKKITYTLKQQQRRASALARFSIDDTRDKTDPAYRARKDQEFVSLEAKLGA